MNNKVENATLPSKNDLIYSQKLQIDQMKKMEKSNEQGNFTSLGDKISQENVCYKDE